MILSLCCGGRGVWIEEHKNIMVLAGHCVNWRGSKALVACGLAESSAADSLQSSHKRSFSPAKMSECTMLMYLDRIHEREGLQWVRN